MRAENVELYKLAGDFLGKHIGRDGGQLDHLALQVVSVPVGAVVLTLDIGGLEGNMAGETGE